MVVEIQLKSYMRNCTQLSYFTGLIFWILNKIFKHMEKYKNNIKSISLYQILLLCIPSPLSLVKFPKFISCVNYVFIMIIRILSNQVLESYSNDNVSVICSLGPYVSPSKIYLCWVSYKAPHCVESVVHIQTPNSSWLPFLERPLQDLAKHWVRQAW